MLHGATYVGGMYRIMTDKTCVHWKERLYIWWYNLTHRHSAKEVPTQEGQ